MIYCSIDIETTGLDPNNHQILSIGVIVEDTTKKLDFDNIPKFNSIILNHNISGHPRALIMNKGIIELMSNYMEADTEGKLEYELHSGYQFLDKDDVIKELYQFLIDHTTSKNGIIPINRTTKPIIINVAGKNFGTFDKLFLEQLPWWKKIIIARQRIIDPTTLCCDWDNDDVLPSLSQCKERLNITGEVQHNALSDAWDVIQILRNFY